MSATRMPMWIMVVLSTVLSCSKPAPSPERGAIVPTKEKATFVNRVWKVVESSSVAPGQLYVFLSEGTLVVASPNGTPSLGTWSTNGGALTMVEEGLSYKVDILGLSETQFQIRINGPGDPVSIRFAPAKGPADPGTDPGR